MLFSRSCETVTASARCSHARPLLPYLLSACKQVLFDADHMLAERTGRCRPSKVIQPMRAINAKPRLACSKQFPSAHAMPPARAVNFYPGWQVEPQPFNSAI